MSEQKTPSGTAPDAASQSVAQNLPTAVQPPLPAPLPAPIPTPAQTDPRNGNNHGPVVLPPGSKRPTFPAGRIMSPGNQSVRVGRGVGHEAARKDIESRPLPPNIYRPGSALKAQALTESLFAPAVPTIAGIAAGLSNDVDNIYRFVASSIEFLPTFGSQKGALGCYIDGIGNAFDQSALMVQLLTAAGYTAKLEFGQIKLTPAQCTAWLGQHGSIDYYTCLASSILMDHGGIPSSVVWDAGTSNYVLLMSHVWVKVDVTGLGNWYLFDPAFKSYNTVAGINMATATGFNVANCITDATTGATLATDYVKDINTANISTHLSNATSSLISWMAANKPDATINDITGARTIVPVTGTVRNTTLTYIDTSVTVTEWTAVPDAYKTTLRVQYDEISGPPVTYSVDQTFFSEDIAGKRLTFFYNGSHQAELKLDGTLVDTSTAQTPFSWRYVFLTVDHPYSTPFVFDYVSSHLVYEGSYYIIANAWGNAGPQMAYMHQKLLNDNKLAGGADTDESVMGEALNVLWHNWNAQKSFAASTIGRLNLCSSLLHHQVGIVGHGESPLTDLGNIVWSTVPYDGDYGNDRAQVTDIVLSQRGIGFESNAIEQIPSVGGVSTNVMMDKANAAGQKLYIADSGNWSTVQTLLTNYSTDDKTGMGDWISQGYKVMVHEDGATSKDDFDGYGYYAISPYGGCVGIITGGLFGGSGSVAQTPGGNVANAAINQVAPDNLDRVEVGAKTEAPIDAVVDKFTGYFSYRHTDYVLGGASFPYSLPFIRYFRSKDLGILTNMGRGWRHNYMITAEAGVDAHSALSQGSGAAAAYNATQMYVAILLLTGRLTDPNSIGFVISHVTTGQASTMLTENVVNVKDGDRAYVFTKLKDGTYASPKGVSMALAFVIDHYEMKSFDGVLYEFFPSGKIKKITYPTGVILTFTYAGAFTENQLLSVSNNVGRGLDFSYTTALFYMTSVQAQGSGQVLATFNINEFATGNLESSTDAAGQPTTYGYDGKYRMTSYSRPVGGVGANMQYNDKDQVTLLTNPKYDIAYSYATGGGFMGAGSGNASSLSTASGGPDGQITTFFNADGQPTSIVVGADTTTYFYDGFGRNVQTILPFGDSVQQSYDLWNRVTTKNHGGLTESFGYEAMPANSWNQWNSYTDPNGHGWSRTFNANGLVASETSPVGTKYWSYDLMGNLQSFTDESGVVTAYTNAGTGERTQAKITSITPNITTNFGIDGVGNVHLVTNARGYTTTFDFDNLRRPYLVTPTAPFASLTTTTSYDNVGNPLSVSRATGGSPSVQTVTTTFSGTNKPLNVTDPLGNVTSHAFDGRDLHTADIDAESRKRQFVYDNNGRVTSIIDANGVTEEQRTYYSGGFLHTITDARGNTSTFTRDGLCRVTRLDYPDPSATYETWGYDNNGNVTSHRTRGGNTISQTFDNANRILTRSPASQPVVTMTYDNAGRLLTASTPTVAGDPSSGTFSRGYDLAGRLISETNPQSEVIGYTLNENGSVSRITYPSGYFVDHVYDELDRLTGIKLNGAGTNAATFGYDGLNRRISKSYNNGDSTSYSYDIGDNRLTMGLSYAGSSGNTWTYGFNKVHEMTSKLPTDSTYEWLPSSPSSVTYGTANQVNEYSTVGGVAQTYNDDGCLTNDGNHTFAYNTEHMLTAVKNAAGTTTIATYLYDPFLRQTQKTVISGSVKTRYVYSGAHLMEEYDCTAGLPGTLLRRYVYAGADEPTFQISAAGVVTYLHHDHLGSLVAQTNSSGVLLNKYTYSPFGECASLTGTVFAYTSQRFDAESGLYYYRARHYNPVIGRFLQPDPVGYRAGMNLYSYVQNDPLNHTDPDGQEPVPVWVKLLGSSYTAIDEITRAVVPSDQPPNHMENIGRAVTSKVKIVRALGSPVFKTVSVSSIRAIGSLPKPNMAAVGRILANGQKSGVYQFVDRFGKWYTGKAKDLAVRLTQHLRSGKLLLENLNSVRTAGAKASVLQKVEQAGIEARGGIKSPNVGNIINAKRQ